MKNRCSCFPCRAPVPCLLPALPLFLLLACTPRQPSPETVALYLSARDSYAAGSLAQAEKQLAAILEQDGEFAQARFLLGKVCFFQGRNADAERAFASLVRGRRVHNEAGIWLVRVMMQEGRIAEAVGRIEKLLASDSSDPRLLFLRGSLALEQEDLKTALDFFGQAAQYGDELARAHLELARLFYQFDLPARALRELAACRALAGEGSPVREAAGKLLDALEPGALVKEGESR
jgi:tetratricopeptide (TPR) repeat protein